MTLKELIDTLRDQGMHEELIKRMASAYDLGYAHALLSFKDVLDKDFEVRRKAPTP